MFLTNNVFKLPLQSMFSGAEGTYWSAVEISLKTPLFLVSFRNPLDGARVDRTLLFSHLEQVEQLADLERTGELELDSVVLVSAKNLNGTENWKTDRLAAVWTAAEPDHPEQNAFVFETCTGNEYLRSSLGTRISRLKERRLLIRFPVDGSPASNWPS